MHNAYKNVTDKDTRSYIHILHVSPAHGHALFAT